MEDSDELVDLGNDPQWQLTSHIQKKVTHVMYSQ